MFSAERLKISEVISFTVYSLIAINIYTLMHSFMNELTFPYVLCNRIKTFDFRDEEKDKETYIRDVPAARQ